MQNTTRFSIFLVLLALGAFFLVGCTDTDTEIPEKAKVAAEDWVSSDNADALPIIEYSDLQCPACRSRAAILKTLEETFEGKIRIIYRHYPLDYHPDAQIAAEASEAAGAQGYFWEMYDEIMAFETKNADGLVDLREENLIKLASGIDGLDVELFTIELQNGEYADKVAEDVASGKALIVSYTPYIMVDGIEYDAQKYGGSYVAMRDYIDSLLNL